MQDWIRGPSSIWLAMIIAGCGRSSIGPASSPPNLIGRGRGVVGHLYRNPAQLTLTKQ